MPNHSQCEIMPLARTIVTSLVLGAAPTIAFGGFGVEHLDRSISKVGAGSLSSAVSPSNGYEVSAQSGDSNVTLKISGSITPTPKPIGSGGDYSGTGWTWSVTAQAPVGKQDSSTTIGTLDGLANSTTVELKLTRVAVSGLRFGGEDVTKYCTGTLLPKYLAADPKNKKEDFVCDSGFVKKNLPGEYGRFRELGYAPSSSIYIFGLNAKGGYQDFDYFQASDLSKQSVRKSPWSAGIFASYAPSSADTLLTGSFKLLESYDDAMSKTLCPSTSPSTPVECVSGPIGVPTKKRKQPLTLEMRRYVSTGIAFSLSATRDFKNKVSGAQLPIYFVGNGDGGLTGGIRFDWASDTHKTSVGIFVGQAFQLFD